LDPRMIKFSSVKMGDGKLESLSRVGSEIPWAEREIR
jgi:small subunit ribosomal protein S6